MHRTGAVPGKAMAWMWQAGGEIERAARAGWGCRVPASQESQEQIAI